MVQNNEKLTVDDINNYFRIDSSDVSICAQILDIGMGKAHNKIINK